MAEDRLLGKPVNDLLAILGRADLKEHLRAGVVNRVRKEVPEILYDFPTPEDEATAIQQGQVEALQAIENAAHDPLRILISIIGSEWPNLTHGKEMSQGHVNEIAQARLKLQYVAARASSWRLTTTSGQRPSDAGRDPVAALWPIVQAADEKVHAALSTRSRILMAAAAGMIALVAATLRDPVAAGPNYAWAALGALIFSAGAIGAGFAVAVQEQIQAQSHAERVRLAQRLSDVPDTRHTSTRWRRAQEALVLIAAACSLVAVWVLLDLCVSKVTC